MERMRTVDFPARKQSVNPNVGRKTSDLEKNQERKEPYMMSGLNFMLGTKPVL